MGVTSTKIHAKKITATDGIVVNEVTIRVDRARLNGYLTKFPLIEIGGWLFCRDFFREGISTGIEKFVPSSAKTNECDKTLNGIWAGGI
ncbi:MAG TPA: hypothetical protein PK667_10270 [Nitrosomonas europaea]|uniref:hypothetical protein n=1 Tax=Nitrosomonas TaxID=914 RepID=UPI00059E0CAF|nr:MULTISPECIES: hypothetical protein [Nitrosomonas]HBF25284.1 hypothetical protein [Nitrosomonas sp.]HRO57009.1 hypothetical protein [Nitrosomonas europaea]HUM74562.1 hypothetical protein [Nitrosomonas europaea]